MNNFKKYQVEDVKTIEEFLSKYKTFKTYKGRTIEEQKACLEAHQEHYSKYGYDFITKHDSITGEIVSFY